ncbi:MAG TPA: PadR family transcriptional regulator [Eubacteriaceae bacterium]|nr:PadR family transcriptional regulator [Eubacteriaceae bacterium]
MDNDQLRILTEPMYYILLSLVQPSHGYGIMQQVEELTKGRVRIGPGTLYNLLSRFQKEGLIVEISQEDRRRTYKITPKGLEVLQEEYNRLHQLLEDGRKVLKGGGC